MSRVNSQSCLANFLLASCLAVGLLAAVAVHHQVEAGKTYCFVRYEFTDEGCAPCCERIKLVASSDIHNACLCIRSIREEFMEKYPNVAERPEAGNLSEMGASR